MDPVEKHVIERNLGEQPISGLMAQLGLKPHDLVAASQSPITHKLIARACKGRRLTPYSQALVLDALNRATEGKHRLNELFNY
jgi:hypothetical protein